MSEKQTGSDKRSNILSSALDVFLRYGYKRVSLLEVAEAAGMSRQGLYLYFKTKEAVFVAAVEQRAEGLLDEIRQGIARKETVEDKLMYAFEVWTIRNFDAEIASPEARELQESTHAFMGASFDKMRVKFEAILASELTKKDGQLSSEKQAHLLYSAMRGLKLSAKNAVELRRMIKSLVGLFLK